MRELEWNVESYCIAYILAKGYVVCNKIRSKEVKNI